MPKKTHYLEYFDFCPKCGDSFGDMICGKSDEQEELKSTLDESHVTCKNCLRLMERRKKVKEKRKKVSGT